MNILVTGAKGFIGMNLVLTLQNIRDGKDSRFGTGTELTVLEYDRNTDKDLLDEYCKCADFVYHLAGVNRPKDQSEYAEGNLDFTAHLLDLLKKYKNTCPVMFASSAQASLKGRYAHSAYGKSKKAAEELLFSYGRDTGTEIYIYRFPNVFGKWCRPDYNSVAATFCYNISHGKPIRIDDRDIEMTFVYIDDVVEELVRLLYGKTATGGRKFCHVPFEYLTTLGELADMIYSFQECQEKKIVPDVTEGSFSKKIYASYLSYLPENEFCRALDMHVDERGSFTEILRTMGSGQFSVNISKPGVVKGGHWHHTKHEKFLVVSGTALIRLQRAGINPRTDTRYPVMEYRVSGDQMELVDIPAGYVHSIVNTGNSDLITFIWSSECFDPKRMDTYKLEAGEPEKKDE